jgi:hypothetical protein
MRAEAPAFLVDTNVLSRRGDQLPGSPVERWVRAYASLIRVSVITVAEVRRGLVLAQRKLDRAANARTRAREQAKLDGKIAWYGVLRSRFADRIEPIDADVAERWADVSVDFPSLRDGDKAILATALVRGYGVATRNLRDFRNAGVPLIDPFDLDTWGPARA